MLSVLCLGSLVCSSILGVSRLPPRQMKRKAQAFFHGIAASSAFFAIVLGAKWFWLVPLIGWVFASCAYCKGLEEKPLWLVELGLLISVFFAWTVSWLH